MWENLSAGRWPLNVLSVGGTMVAVARQLCPRATAISSRRLYDVQCDMLDVTSSHVSLSLSLSLCLSTVAFFFVIFFSTVTTICTDRYYTSTHCPRPNTLARPVLWNCSTKLPTAALTSVFVHTPIFVILKTHCKGPKPLTCRNKNVAKSPLTVHSLRHLELKTSRKNTL